MIPIEAGSRRQNPVLGRLVAGLIALAVAYTVRRAFVLRIEYSDGYGYLANARALLGDRIGPYLGGRPPFVTLAELPAVAIARLGAPATRTWLVAPHLTSAILSIAAAAAVFWVYHRPFGTQLAALGTLLFVATPYFVRYGPHAMADLPSAGWAAATFALYLGTQERRTAGAYALCGVAFGCAVLTKYPMALLGAALVLAELGAALCQRRWDPRRWAYLLLSGAVAATVCAAVSGAIIFVAYGGNARDYWSSLQVLWRLTAFFAARHHESWRDYGSMSAIMVSIPTLALAGLGVARALIERDVYDIPFLAWLVTIGGSVVFLISHNEARYLLPAVPAIIYFAVRGVRVLLRGSADRTSRARPLASRGLAALAAVLVGWAVLSGIHQATLDQDAAFFSDVERRATEALLRARRPGGRLLWLGRVHTFHTHNPAGVSRDEFFNVFHFGASAAAYLAGEPVQAIGADTDQEALVSQVIDGDAIFRAADVMYETGTVPDGGVPPPEIWAVRRLELRRVDGNRLVTTQDPSFNLRVRETDGDVVVSPERAYGTWILYYTAPPIPAPQPLGRFDLGAGEEIHLGPASGPWSGLLLLRIDRVTF